MRLGRSPHGERGLKSFYRDEEKRLASSLPSRGAWIEIISQPVSVKSLRSLPSRGAWIEILTGGYQSQRSSVAPLTGSVD